eukprot:7243069-Prymnesium_polylepis.1
MGDSLTQSCCCKPGSSRCCGDKHGNESTVCCRESYRSHLASVLKTSWGANAFTFVGSQERRFMCSEDAGAFEYAGETLASVRHSSSHQGHWGWTTAQLLEWTKYFVRRAAPDVVLLMIGLNDLVHLPSGDTKSANAQIRASLQNVRKMIDAATRAWPGVKVLLGTLPICERRPYQPIGQKAPTIMCPNPSAIPGYNAGLNDLVRDATGTPDATVSICETGDGFDARTMTYDGIHPNSMGASHLGLKWGKCIKAEHVPRASEFGRTSSAASILPLSFAFDAARTCAASFSDGKWVKVQRERFEVGSIDFYESCYAARGISEARCDDWAWEPKKDKDGSCPQPFVRFNSSGVRELLRGKWVAFLGDSAIRLVFSSLVHALNGSLTDPSYPTHDFSHQEHGNLVDHCMHGKCFRDFALDVDNEQTRVSFDMFTTLDSYPGRAERFFYGRYGKVRATPDILVMNAGSWDFFENRYSAQRHQRELWNFLVQLVKFHSGPSYWLSNTFVPKGNNSQVFVKRSLEVNDVHKLQAPILEHFRHVMIDRGPLFRPLPTFYDNRPGKFNPFHLPGLITDESLQLLLNVIRSSVPAPLASRPRQASEMHSMAEHEGRQLQQQLAAKAPGLGLFCGGSDEKTSSSDMYSGPNFVYTFSCDPVTQLLVVASAINAYLTAAPGASKAPATGLAFVSVVGGLSCFNMLSVLPTPDVVVLYDTNPWMVEYARMVVEIVKLSPTRLHFVSRMFSRNASEYLLASGHTELTPAAEAAYLTLPAKRSLEQQTQGLLSDRARCTHKWLTQQLVPPLGKKPTRRVCEDVRLFFDPSSMPPLFPEILVGRCRTDRCRRTTNVCSLYFGEGWLATEAAFVAVQKALFNVKFTQWSITQPLTDLWDIGKFPRSILYCSNIEAFLPKTISFPRILSRWADEVRAAGATELFIPI